MLRFINPRWRQRFHPRPLKAIKELARVLVIDDRKPQLIDDLAKEGWRVRYQKDLDSYENTDLMDAHIICLDINDVGKKLRCENGMGLVTGIKDKYPSKKILLYSSERRGHDIFDSAVDLVDKRLYKDGQPYPFIKAVQELAINAFDWQHCVEDIYNKFKASFGLEMTLVEFEKRLKKCVKNNGNLDTEDIMKKAYVSLQVAANIAQIASLAVTR